MDLDLELDDELSPVSTPAVPAQRPLNLQTVCCPQSQPPAARASASVSAAVPGLLPGPAGLVQAAKLRGHQDIGDQIGGSRLSTFQSSDPSFSTPTYRRAVSQCRATPIVRMPESQNTVEACLVFVEDIISSAEGDAFVSLKVLRSLVAHGNNHHAFCQLNTRCVGSHRYPARFYLSLVLPTSPAAAAGCYCSPFQRQAPQRVPEVICVHCTREHPGNFRTSR
jgi:hypothetical protein